MKTHSSQNDLAIFGAVVERRALNINLYPDLTSDGDQEGPRRRFSWKKFQTDRVIPQIYSIFRGRRRTVLCISITIEGQQ